ncbi:HAMP domain-containing protein [Actinoplanes sp. TBRC 11911]|uniref:HAMP domain-containing protein n=1 Tax=Actinoplanes sp. TBRC 11911 TaxID=2729386 RepID=UPI00145C99F2|nr:HAMP domain-containing protein [Actinoplanes sp. TBRC 11911]NMO54810.1 HAMP domain-containing protein [Actinoplanes sp. TBRC 11911]
MKIQTQLTVVVAAVVTFVVAVAGVLIVMRNDNQATDQIDNLLSSKAAAVRTAAIQSGKLPTDGTYAVRLISAGKVVKQVGTTAQLPLPTSDGYTNVAGGGSEWRSLSETLISGAQMQILVSLTNVREQHTSNVLKVDLLVVLAALLSAAGVWFATGRVLRPFQRLIAAARGLRPGDRLPEVKSPREVAELSSTLNAMLDRVSTESASGEAWEADAVTREALTPGDAVTGEIVMRADQGVPEAPGPADAVTRDRTSLADSVTRELPMHPGPAPDISGMSDGRRQASRPPERQPEIVSTVERPVDVTIWQPEGARAAGPQPGGPQAEALDLDGLDLSLRPQLDGLGTNLDALMDNPDMPATQRHLILALMADEHREIVAELDRLRARSEG